MISGFWFFVFIVTYHFKGPFGIAILISAILKITFSKIVFLISPFFKIAQAFGKTY